MRIIILFILLTPAHSYSIEYKDDQVAETYQKIPIHLNGREIMTSLLNFLNRTIVADSGRVFLVKDMDNQGSDEVEVYDPILEKTYMYKKSLLRKEVKSYGKLKISDTVIALSAGATSGEIWKLFSDGTGIILTESHQIIIGKNLVKIKTGRYYKSKNIILPGGKVKTVESSYNGNYVRFQKGKKLYISKLIWNKELGNKYMEDWIVAQTESILQGRPFISKISVAYDFYNKYFLKKVRQKVSRMNNDQFFTLVKNLIWDSQIPVVDAAILKSQLEIKLAIPLGTF